MHSSTYSTLKEDTLYINFVDITDAQDILRGNVMRAIQKTNKHVMEEIGKTNQKRDRAGPKG